MRKLSQTVIFESKICKIEYKKVRTHVQEMHHNPVEIFRNPYGPIGAHGALGSKPYFRLTLLFRPTESGPQTMIPTDAGGDP